MSNQTTWKLALSALSLLFPGVACDDTTPSEPTTTTTTTTATLEPQQMHIVIGSSLAPGFDIGVDTSRMERNWLILESGQFRMSYPSGQAWGAVFITHGGITQQPRRGIDLSGFTRLVVDMKGLNGEERIEIGIKDVSQPDDGSETKVAVTLGSDWVGYEFALARFTRTDPKNLWVVIEFVFSGRNQQDVFFRNVRYLSGP